jgi:phenylalanyl-tRNA synthetase beta subunit
MVFRATDRTLSSEEVTAEVDRIVARLSAEFSAELRSR